MAHRASILLYVSSSADRSISQSSVIPGISMADVRNYLDAMRRMHVHHPLSSEDNIWKSVRPIVKASKSPADSVRRALFFLQFSYMSKFKVGKQFMQRASRWTAPKFACMCWKKRVLPVSPRFGRQTGKVYHAQLKKFAARGAKRAFCAKIVSIHQALPSPKRCRAFSDIIQREDVNRVEDVPQSVRGRACHSE
jgi:hypothetical protein